MLAALVECAFELRAQGRGFVSDEDAQTLRELRNEYSKLDLKAALGTYRVDLQRVHQILQTIGTNVANNYQSEIEKLAAVSPAPSDPARDDPFRDDERQLEQLPSWIAAWERFLCLLYLAFIRIIIARLRTLAISIVSVWVPRI